MCEGQRTEPDYVNGYRRFVKNSAVKVRIATDHGDPRRIVEIAKQEKETAEAEAKKQGDDWLAFDEVWCVFDRDEHPRFHDAITMARDNGMELAVSNPCFELWLLLHFRESPGARHRHDLQDLLRNNHLPKYDKKLDFTDFANGLDAAAERAKRLDKAAADRGDPPHGNPTTSFYRLTESIARKDAT